MSGGWTKAGLSGAAIVALAMGIFFYAGTIDARMADEPAGPGGPVIGTRSSNTSAIL